MRAANAGIILIMPGTVTIFVYFAKLILLYKVNHARLIIIHNYNYT